MSKRQLDKLSKFSQKPKAEESKETTIVEPTETTNEVTNEESSEVTTPVGEETDFAAELAGVVASFHEEQAKKELKSEVMGNYTLVIRHDTMDRLDNLAEHYPRGFKSELVNKALEAFIDLYEKKPLPEKRNKRKR